MLVCGFIPAVGAVRPDAPAPDGITAMPSATIESVATEIPARRKNPFIPLCFIISPFHCIGARSVRPDWTHRFALTF
jgi:hypothetical protein